jgi:uncharacterized protein (UPF0335 family)
MGRPAGSKNKPRNGDAQTGHNSEPSLAEQKEMLTEAVKRISALKTEMDILAEDLKEVFDEYKERGVPRADISFALKMHAMSDVEAKAHAELHLQITTWMHPTIQAAFQFSDAAAAFKDE